MTGTPISPLAMPPLPQVGSSAGPATAGWRLTVLDLPSPRSVSLVYHLASVDQWGRVVARAAVEALGWSPGTRLAMREQGGLIRVTAEPAGPSRVTKQGHLRVPLALRRWCYLDAGTQVLVVAEPSAEHLVIHPLAAVDTMVARLHGAVFGGDAA